MMDVLPEFFKFKVVFVGLQLAVLFILCVDVLHMDVYARGDEKHGQSKLNKFIYHFEPLNYDRRPLNASSSKQHPNTIHWEFTAYGRVLHIQLSPYSNIISPSAKLHVVNSESHIKTTDLVSLQYKGKVIGDQHSSVHGHIINGTFDGIIKSTAETFHIEPAYRYLGSPNPNFHSVIYRATDVQLPHFTTRSSTCQLCSLTLNSSSLFSAKYSQFKAEKDPNIFLHGRKRHQKLAKYHAAITLSNSQQSTNLFQTTQKSVHLSYKTSYMDKVFHPKRRTQQFQEYTNETSRRQPLAGYEGNAKNCMLHVVVDHTFFQHVAGGDVTSAIAEVAYHIEEANSFYKATDFDNDGSADNVGLAIGGITIFESATTHNYLIGAEYHDPEEFLDDFSLYNFSAYCIGLVFTYRDFQGGILGLAWMGYSGDIDPPGGICQEPITYRDDGQASSLNTAMVTFVNYGEYVPRSVSVTSVLHEIGHAFGSLHDPPTRECSPSGLQGNYIMHSQATDGNKPNNFRFSSCSRNQMALVIASKGHLCLEAGAGPYCGNGLVEDGEECDCGTPSTCELSDDCCTPRGGMGIDAECTLRRELGRVCSPRLSDCCDDNCHIIPASWHQYCFADNECLMYSVCNGSSAECPQPEARPDGSVCADGTKRCLHGRCIVSACYDVGLQECTCLDSTGNSTQLTCQLCCQFQNNCMPAAALGLTAYNGDAIVKQPGTACNNYTGYCDLQGLCVTLETDSALDKLNDLWRTETNWIKRNWFYILIGTVCVYILLSSSRMYCSYYHDIRMRQHMQNGEQVDGNLSTGETSHQPLTTQLDCA